MTMPSSDPTQEAEWIVREIIDDYAQGLDRADRTIFLNRLSKLIAERCEPDEASDESAGQIN